MKEFLKSENILQLHFARAKLLRLFHIQPFWLFFHPPPPPRVMFIVFFIIYLT